MAFFFVFEHNVPHQNNENSLLSSISSRTSLLPKHLLRVAGHEFGGVGRREMELRFQGTALVGSWAVETPIIIIIIIAALLVQI